MRQVIAFYLEGCPYCKQARKALEELKGENSNYASVNMEWIEENQHPEISNQYDYYSVPSMFVDGQKIYEAHRGEKYEECKANVKRVLEASLC